MNKTKIVLMTTLLGSVLGLAACQVTPSEQAMNHDRHRHEMQRQPLTLNNVQNGKLNANNVKNNENKCVKNIDYREHRSKACQGKRIGERVNVQWNNRVIEGTCDVRFTPEKSQFKR
jgi:hypothetical protein